MKLTTTQKDFAGRLTTVMTTIVKNHLELGKILAEAKEELPHGEFLPMIQSIGITAKTAQRYMKLSKMNWITDTTFLSYFNDKQIAELDKMESGTRENIITTKEFPKPPSVITPPKSVDGIIRTAIKQTVKPLVVDAPTVTVITTPAKSEIKLDEDGSYIRTNPISLLDYVSADKQRAETYLTTKGAWRKGQRWSFLYHILQDVFLAIEQGESYYTELEYIDETDFKIIKAIYDKFHVISEEIHKAVRAIVARHEHDYGTDFELDETLLGISEDTENQTRAEIHNLF